MGLTGKEERAIIEISLGLFAMMVGVIISDSEATYSGLKMLSVSIGLVIAGFVSFATGLMRLMR